MGIGGITYEGAGEDDPPRPCDGQGEYKILDIPYCQVNTCPDISHTCAAPDNQSTASAASAA